MPLEFWVDYSMYQGRVGEDVLKRMVVGGVVGVCVGSWHGKCLNEFAEANLRDARGLKLKTATYTVLNSSDGRAPVAQARNACGMEWTALKFVALDVEVPGVTEQAIRDAIDEVRFWGQRPCLYTGNWFWDLWAARLGHDPVVLNPPTWLAYYNGKQDLDVPTRPSYGPIVGHQYAGTTSRYGTQVDLNAFDPAWINAREEMMEKEEFNKRFAEAAAEVLLVAVGEDGKPVSGARSLEQWLASIVRRRQQFDDHVNQPHIEKMKGDDLPL